GQFTMIAFLDNDVHGSHFRLALNKCCMDDLVYLLNKKAQRYVHPALAVRGEHTAPFIDKS
ncbi:MAG TPA: hypothetical protein VF313_03775, partial [Anaerolineaceae bacterium]